MKHAKLSVKKALKCLEAQVQQSPELAALAQQVQAAKAQYDQLNMQYQNLQKQQQQVKPWVSKTGPKKTLLPQQPAQQGYQPLQGPPRPGPQGPPSFGGGVG